LFVHDLRTNQNSTKHTLTETNDLNTKKELKEIRISEQKHIVGTTTMDLVT